MLLHAAGLANGPRQLQPFQIDEKAALMAAEAAEREQEERDLEARLAQASRGDGQACCRCRRTNGTANGRRALGNGRAYATVNVRARLPYAHESSVVSAEVEVAAELLCEQCMWRCSRCGCHEFAGFCLRHNASRDVELLPSLKLTTSANAHKITALLDKETQEPLHMVDRCGCCLQRQDENSQRFKKGELELEDRPGDAFRRGMLSPLYTEKVLSKPQSYQSGAWYFQTQLGKASRVSACRLATYTQLPTRVARPTALGFNGRHAVRLGLEGGADHLRSVLSYIKRNGLHEAQQAADGADWAALAEAEGELTRMF